jgi:nucleoside-diphosphate-sugar epimerase
MILITGTSGFIGKHLLSAVIKEYGREAVVALTSAPVTGCRYLLHNNYNFDKDYFFTNDCSHIHTIIHAGAFTPKNGKQANDWKQCNSNIFNTDRLLSAGLPELQKVIYLSTLDVYGKCDVVTEQSAISPVSLYGDSKYYCEKMINAWSDATKKLGQVLRVGHVYGPGEEAYEKLIPVTMTRLIEGKPVQLWGNGEETRAFIYIKDVIKAILASLKLEDSPGPINLVSDQTVHVRGLIDKIIDISGLTPTLEKIPTTSAARSLRFDSGKMKKYLLPAELPLQDGLIEEWNYMKSIV